MRRRASSKCPAEGLYERTCSAVMIRSGSKTSGRRLEGGGEQVVVDVGEDAQADARRRPAAPAPGRVGEGGPVGQAGGEEAVPIRLDLPVELVGDAAGHLGKDLAIGPERAGLDPGSISW